MSDETGPHAVLIDVDELRTAGGGDPAHGGGPLIELIAGSSRQPIEAHLFIPLELARRLAWQILDTCGQLEHGSAPPPARR